jgi:hypothetical protein
MEKWKSLKTIEDTMTLDLIPLSEIDVSCIAGLLDGDGSFIVPKARPGKTQAPRIELEISCVNITNSR